MSDVTTSSCVVSWVHPEGHSCLRGFQIQILQPDGKIYNDFACLKNATKHEIKDLLSCQDYEISIKTLCKIPENDRGTESEDSWAYLTTLPEKIKNLKEENSGPHSLTVKWDALIAASNLKYRLTINGNTKSDDEPDKNVTRPNFSVGGNQSATSISSQNIERNNLSRSTTVQDIGDYHFTKELTGIYQVKI